MRAAALLAAVLAAAATAASAARSGPFDRRIAAEWALPDRTDLFSPAVFDPVFYPAENNLTGDGGARMNSREARRHWVDTGVRVGLRASKRFWAKAYLEHNVDVRDRYGADNFPMAVIHYLTRGVNETWRETGGPRRDVVFDPRIFDWRYYAKRNALPDEEHAREHWRHRGLDSGLQASPDIHLAEYLAANEDLRHSLGPRNYAAAAAYFVDRGHAETWRQNGGQTCRFWGTWCQNAAVAALAEAGTVPMPRYVGGGVSHAPGFQAPVPQAAGVEVEVNGRVCAELSHRDAPRPEHSRVETVFRTHFRGLAGYVRPCSVFVRHLVDLQTSVQGSEPEELSLRHYHFEDDAPLAALQRPDNITYTTYSGYTWVRRPDSRTDAADRYTGEADAATLNYTVSSFLMVDPATESPGGQEALAPRRLWSLDHRYSPAPGAPANFGPWGHVAKGKAEADDVDIEALRAAHAKANTFYQPVHYPYKNKYMGDGIIDVNA